MKRLFLIVGMALSVLSASAQTELPGSCVVALPKLLEPDLLKDKDIKEFLESRNWGQDNKTNSYWKVYSDRANNVTYKSPNNKSDRFATLNLNDELRIAKIQNGYALVYVEQYTAAIYPIINKPISKGWVPMSHLLLWSSCPADEKGIYHKALPLVNVDEFMKAKERGTEKDMGKVFDNPMAKSNPKKLKASMEFYFVMKEDPESGLVLLSRRNKLTGKTSQVLYGWVNKASYVSWNQRSCLEPNWTAEVAEKFLGKNVPVYFDSKLSEQCASMPLGRINNIVNDEDPTRYRMYPDEMRYPILDNDSQNDAIYKVTAFVRPGDSKGHVLTIRSDEDKSKIELREKAANQIRTINIIMVIDATSSMKEFYPTVQKIVQEANSYFSKETGNVVKVGVVLYRDYPDGKYCTEYLPIKSPNSAELATFLEKGGDYGIRSVAFSATEALYKGVEVALDPQKMGYNPMNSNMLFIIGDCGNDPNDTKCLSVDELVKKAVDLNMQISAFQVYNPNDTPYKLFRQNTNDLVKNIVEAQYQLKKTKLIQIYWEPKVDGFEFRTNLPAEQQFFIGNTRRPKSGEKMEISKLYDIIRSSYIQFNTCIEARVAAIYSDDVDDPFIDEGRTASAEANLTLWYKYYGENVIKKWAQDGLITAKEGYTRKKDIESGYDYWLPVIYISRAEYDDLMLKLQPVMAAAEEGSEDRRPYINAMKELIRTLYGNIPESQVMSMDTKKVMALVAGLNVKSDALNGKTLEQIEDNMVVGQDEFATMISDFQTKYRKLDRIKNGYKYSVEIVGDMWYWIPVQDLP